MRTENELKELLAKSKVNHWTIEKTEDTYELTMKDS